MYIRALYIEVGGCGNNEMWRRPSKDKMQSTRVLPDGTEIVTKREPDPRFVLQVPRMKSGRLGMPVKI